MHWTPKEGAPQRSHNYPDYKHGSCFTTYTTTTGRIHVVEEVNFPLQLGRFGSLNTGVRVEAWIQ